LQFGRKVDHAEKRCFVLSFLLLLGFFSPVFSAEVGEGDMLGLGLTEAEIGEDFP